MASSRSDGETFFLISNRKNGLRERWSVEIYSFRRHQRANDIDFTLLKTFCDVSDDKIIDLCCSNINSESSVTRGSA